MDYSSHALKAWIAAGEATICVLEKGISRMLLLYRNVRGLEIQPEF
jgi:hypothetical protein